MKIQHIQSIQLFKQTLILPICLAVIVLSLLLPHKIYAQWDRDKIEAVAQSASLNMSQSGELNKQANGPDVDWWAITITRPGVLFIKDSVVQSSNQSGDIKYSILLHDDNPPFLGNNKIVRPISRIHNNDEAIRLGVLPGRYYIQLSSYHACSYKIYPEFIPFAGIDELNDTRVTAQNMELNTNNYGNIGYWNPQTNDWDNVDWWIFNVDQAGELNIMDSITLCPENISKGIISYNLFDENANTILGEGRSVTLDIKVKVLPGTYFFRLQHQAYNWTKHNMPYFNYRIYPKFTAIPGDFEINDDAERAQNLVLNNENLGNLSYWNPDIQGIDKTDWWEITINQAGILDIEDKVVAPNNGFYDIFLWDEDRSNRLAYWLKRNSSSGPEGISRALMPGRYFLELKSHKNKMGDRYKSFEYSIFPEFTPVPEDNENNDSLNLATNLNQSNQGNIGFWNPEIDAKDKQDWMRISVGQYGELRLQHRSILPSVNNRAKNYKILIYDEDGTRSINMIFGAVVNKNTAVGLMPGIYYLNLEGPRWHNTGYGGSYDSYEITSEFTSITEIDEQNDSKATAQSIDFDTKAYGNIGYYDPSLKRKDNVDWWSFTVRETGSIKIHYKRLINSPGRSTHIYIYRHTEPQSTSVWNNGDIIQFEPGTYYFYIGGNKEYCTYGLYLEFVSLSDQYDPYAPQFLPDDQIDLENKSNIQPPANPIASDTTRNSINNVPNNPQLANNQNSNTPGKTYEECRSKYCPECDNSIILLGVAADADCQACLDKNKELIEQCMKGSNTDIDDAAIPDPIVQEVPIVHDVPTVPDIPDCQSIYPNTVAKWNARVNQYECDCIQGYEWNTSNTECIEPKPDCSSFYPNTVARWNASINQYECDCIQGFVWNTANTACIEPVPDCQSIYSNTVARWNASANKYECDCIQGYVWNTSYTECIKPKPDCRSFYPNTVARWDAATNKYECDCIQGFVWNTSNTACIESIPDCNAQYPNSIAVWNNATNRYECRCTTGYKWNNTKTRCKKIADPDKTMNAITGILNALSGGINGVNNAENPTVKPEYQKTGECSTSYGSGATEPEQYTIDVYQTYGTVKFNYETYDKKDRIQVYYGNSKIYDSGCVGENKTITFNLNGYSSVFRIVVNPLCDPTEKTTQWKFNLGCPQ